MDKPKLLKIVNLLLSLAFLSLATTGLIKFPGLMRAFGVKLSDLPIITISQIHDYSGLSLVILGLAHIWLNWGWFAVTFHGFTSQIKGGKPKQN